MELLLEGGGRMKEGGADFTFAVKLARILKNEGHTARVSACGGLAKALLTARLVCDGFTYHQDIREPLKGFRQVVDIRKLSETMGQPEHEVVLSLYHGLLLKAEAYIFFPGREETKAILMDAITLNTNILGKLPGGRFRPIALVGWKDHDLLAFYTLVPKTPRWLANFGFDDPNQIVSFVTKTDPKS